MPVRVFLDTCVLVSAIVTDVVLTLADHKLLEPRWSDDVLLELRGVLERSNTLSRDQIDHRIGAMGRAFPRAIVTGYEPITGQMTCHEKDRHILAAAITGRCRRLVTFNVRDFPPSSVHAMQMDVVHPDDFLLNMLSGNADMVERAVTTLIQARRNPRLTIPILANRLERAGVPGFATEVHRLEGARPPQTTM